MVAQQIVERISNTGKEIEMLRQDGVVLKEKDRTVDPDVNIS